MKKVTMSIILPIYNNVPYLERLFQSLVNQTWQEFEIIAINDGSTDHPENIIDIYRQFFGERLRYYEQENKGLAATRNVGLRIAQGDYIAFIDSDDYVTRNFCEKMMTSIDGYDIVVCGVTVFRDGEIYEHDHVCHTQIKSGFELAKDSLRRRNAAQVVWNKLYRREIVKDFNFVEGRVYEDMYGCAIIPLSAAKVKYICDELYLYCMREASISRHITDRNAYDLKNNFISVMEVYKSYGVLSYMAEDLRVCLADMIGTMCKWYIHNDLSESCFKEVVEELLKLKKDIRYI